MFLKTRVAKEKFCLRRRRAKFWMSKNPTPSAFAHRSGLRRTQSARSSRRLGNKIVYGLRIPQKEKIDYAYRLHFKMRGWKTIYRMY